MGKDNILSDAVAEAKKIRDTALATAKESLDEYITPRIQEMLRKKLSEEEQVEVKEAVGETVEEEINEQGLDEMLKELENEESLEENTGEVTEQAGVKQEAEVKEQLGLSQEAKDEESSEAEEEGGEEEGGEQSPEAEALPGEEGVQDDQEVVEMTVGELRDLIADTLLSLGVGGEQAADEPTLEPVNAATADVKPEDELSLDETLESLNKEEKVGEQKVQEKQQVSEKTDWKAKYAKAVKVVKFLQEEMNSMSVLNAKLLYTNKIFKAKSLTESQKVKVISAFEKVDDVKGVKKVYEKLMNSPAEKTIGRKPIKESLGFASKPMGKGPVKPIVEQDEVVTRLQELAGLVKPKF